MSAPDVPVIESLPAPPVSVSTDPDEGAYLHVGSHAPVIQVVGVVKEEMAGSNVLWLLS